MTRNDFGRWGAELNDGAFARAVAAIGMLDRWPYPVIDFIDWLGLEPDLVRLLRNPDELNGETRGKIAERIAQVLEVIPERSSSTLIWRPYALRSVLWNLSSGLLDDDDRALLAALAGPLAEAWLVSVDSPRLAVDLDNELYSWYEFRQRDLDTVVPWVLGQLSHPEVGAASVVGLEDRPDFELEWQWPLRVGLLSDERSNQLREGLHRKIEETSWLQPLVSIVDGAREASDLLLIPLDLQMALAAVATLPSPPRTDLVISLGRTRGEAARWYSQVRALRATARTSGVVLAHVSLDDQPQWLTSVVESLSHADPLDVALFGASRALEAPAPFLTMSPRLLQFSSLRTQVRRTAERLRQETTGESTIDLSELRSASDVLGLDGQVPFDVIADRLEEAPDAAFIGESYMATALSEVEDALKKAVAESKSQEPSADRPRRYIQARVWDVTDPREPVQRRSSFRGGAVHQLVARVGLPDKDWISGPSEASFPDDRLPEEDEHHRLTVVFDVLEIGGEPPNPPIAPQVGSVVLPRRGNSTECTFNLNVPIYAGHVETRLTVLYKNRVLQTTLVMGPISEESDEPVRSGDKERETLAVEPEVEVRAGLDDLTFRESFDVAIVANHTSSGLSGATVMSDETARRIDVSGDMAQVLRTLGAHLSRIAYDLPGFSGLRADATVNLLRTLAKQGWQLYRHLVKDALGEAAVARGERVQVISARPEARLPIEAVYARKAPREGAPLCPGAEEALREGACPVDCAGRSDEREFVCPLAFWGLSRVIERHQHDPDLARDATEGRDFALWAPEPSKYRQDLPVLEGGLVAGSHRVEATVPGGLLELCGDIAAGLKPLDSWKEWVDEVRATSPTLLALLVHVETSDASLPQIEIGKEQWLTADQLDEEHVRGTKDGLGPLVMLLGCKTGAPAVMEFGFVTGMRWSGAALVLASDATIHADHALPVARALVSTLRNAVSNGSRPTFGEVMRTARRTLLADGHPMVLALTAYGDADWRLIP